MLPALWIGWGAAIALSVGGLVTLLFGLSVPATVGWFAYSPLPAATFSTAGVVLLSRTAVVGLILMIIGLVGVGFLVGLRYGSRLEHRP